MKAPKPPKGWKPPGKPIPRHLRPTTWHSSSSTEVPPPPIGSTADQDERQARLRRLLWEPYKGPMEGR